jgi:hypothetical protein
MHTPPEEKYTEDGLKIVTTNPVYFMEKPSPDGKGIVQFIVTPRTKEVTIVRKNSDGIGTDYQLTLQPPAPFGPDVEKRIFAVDHRNKTRQSFYPQQNVDAAQLMGYFSVFKTAIQDVLSIASP